MGAVSEAAVKAMPRRGRLWVVAILAVGLFALGYSIVQISTQKPDDSIVHVAGISEAQEIFGGIPQEGDRFGSSDAPVTVQLFNDLQCSNCREDFVRAIPTLAENYARPGDVKFLYRHYANGENPTELGFFGAEAAAEQGYGWQYTYLFFRNQDEAERLGVDQNFLDSIAGGVEELNFPEWEKTLEEDGGANGPIAARLKGYEDLGRGLGIRTGQAAIVSGPNGSRTIQDGAKLGQIEQAIEEVQ
jgi:protein-disulfide isomerase